MGKPEALRCAGSVAHEILVLNLVSAETIGIEVREDGIRSSINAHPTDKALGLKYRNGQGALILQVGMPRCVLHLGKFRLHSDTILICLVQRREGRNRYRRHADPGPEFLAHDANADAISELDEI